MGCGCRVTLRRHLSCRLSGFYVHYVGHHCYPAATSAATSGASCSASVSRVNVDGRGVRSLAEESGLVEPDGLTEAATTSSAHAAHAPTQPTKLGVRAES